MPTPPRRSGRGLKPVARNIPGKGQGPAGKKAAPGVDGLEPLAAGSRTARGAPRPGSLKGVAGQRKSSRLATKNQRNAALMPTPTRRSRSGRGLKPVERFIPNIWQRARRRLWLTGSRHRGGMHRGKIVAARRLGNAWEYRFRWEGYGELDDDWLKRDLVSRGALQEFRATSRSTKRAVGRARGASSDSAGAAVARASNSVQQREARDERIRCRLLLRDERIRCRLLLCLSLSLVLHVRLYADLLSTCVCVCVCVSTVCGLGLVLLAVLLGAPLVSLLQVAPPLVSLLQVGLLVLQRGKCS